MPTGQYFRQQKLVMQVKVHRNMSKMEHSVEDCPSEALLIVHTITHVLGWYIGTVIPSQGNNPAAPLIPHSTVMPSTSCKHGKE